MILPKNASPQTHSFLVRCWAERCTPPSVWRFSVQNVRTGERLGFANLEDALAHIQQQLNGRFPQNQATQAKDE